MTNKGKIHTLRAAAVILFMASWRLLPAADTSAWIDEKRFLIVDSARSYIGTRYSRGGASDSGFDCSGFVMYIYGAQGIRLPRTSREQFEAGEEVPLQEALAGDLMFFKINGRRISPSAIYLGDRLFIHSPSTGKRVRIDSVDDAYWKKRFCGTVRIPGL